MYKKKLDVGFNKLLEINNDFKRQIESSSKVQILGNSVYLNKKLRKFILKPEQSIIDSKYTPNVFKRILISKSKIRNQNTQKTTKQLWKMKNINNFKTERVNVELELLHFLKEILEKRLYESNIGLIDVFVISSSWNELDALVLQLKNEGNKELLDSVVDRLVELQFLYNLPLNDVVPIIERSGNFQILCDVLVSTHDVDSLKKLCNFCHKYGFFKIEVWALRKLLNQINIFSYQDRLSHLENLMSNLDVDYSYSDEEILSLDLNSESTLASYIIRKILNGIESSRVVHCTDISKVMIVGMHQGTGGSPQKAMRLASYLQQNSEYNCIYVSPSYTPNNTQAQNKDLFNSGVLTKVLEDIEVDEEQLKREFQLEFIEDVHPNYRRKSILKFIEVFRSASPEVVHIIGTMELEIQAAVAALIVGIPKIVVNPGMMSPEEYAITVQHKVESNFNLEVLKDLILFPNISLYNNSKVAALNFDEWLGVEDYTNVLYNGINLPNNESYNKANNLKLKYGKHESSKIIGVIGRLAYEKLPFNILEAMKTLSKDSSFDDISLVFIGDGPLREPMYEYILEHGLSNRVFIYGFTTEMDEIYPDLDLCLLVSLGEGLPNVLLEAQSHGVPILTVDVGGCVETIKENDTGIVLQNNTPQEISTKIVHVLLDKSFLESASNNARQWVRSNFSMKTMSDNAIDIYNNK